MEGAIYIRGVTKMTAFQFEIEVFFNAVNFHGEGRTIMEMVYNSVNIR